MSPESANLAVAVLALATAAISVVFTWKGLKNQEKHNSLSVVPVPFIALADYENLIRVKIRNDGLGPLIVNGIDYKLDNKTNEFEELVQYLPDPPHPLYWSNFSSGYFRSIRPGDELILIEIKIDESSHALVTFRNQLRSILSQMTIAIRYTDVYNNPFPIVSRDLLLFARRLATSKEHVKRNA
jgi:hypothetical protein